MRIRVRKRDENMIRVEMNKPGWREEVISGRGIKKDGKINQKKMASSSHDACLLSAF
jgi:hypothetical protein